MYVPHRGELALTVPAFGPHVLGSYEQARQTGATRLMPLAELQRIVEAIRHARLPEPGGAPRRVQRDPATSPGSGVELPSPQPPPPAAARQDIDL